jgi:plastocyanin
MKGRRFITAAVVVLLSAAVGTAVRASGKDGDKDKVAAVHAAMVNFGQPQNQTPDAAAAPGQPATVGAGVTHFLLPNDVTITKGGTVTFVVNGGGHGIAIHPVSKDTTREDIAADLCDGNNHETGAGNEITDRRARFGACGGNLVATTATINNTAVLVTGTANLDYLITDGKDDLIIDTGFNVTAANTNPATVVNNPRVDDTEHTVRLFSSSGAPPVGESAVTANTAAGLASAGGFLTGSAPAVAPATVGTPGNRIQVRFPKTGRYLVICMNRAHSINDHMFGFVNVVGDDDDKEQ